jgi:hypothetical protein
VKKNDEYWKGRTRPPEPARTVQNGTADSEFVNVELSEVEKTRLKDMYIDFEELDIVLGDLLVQGYKVTVKRDDRNNCYVAFCFPPSDSENAGYILTGRGGVVSRALRQLAFKHAVMLEGDWAGYYNRERPADDQDW